MKIISEYISANIEKTFFKQNIRSETTGDITDNGVRVANFATSTYLLAESLKFSH
jgi:hypothetical protein